MGPLSQYSGLQPQDHKASRTSSTDPYEERTFLFSRFTLTMFRQRSLWANSSPFRCSSWWLFWARLRNRLRRRMEAQPAARVDDAGGCRFCRRDRDVPVRRRADAARLDHPGELDERLRPRAGVRRLAQKNLRHLPHSRAAHRHHRGRDAKRLHLWARSLELACRHHARARQLARAGRAEGLGPDPAGPQRALARSHQGRLRSRPDHICQPTCAHWIACPRFSDGSYRRWQWGQPAAQNAYGIAPDKAAVLAMQVQHAGKSQKEIEQEQKHRQSQLRSLGAFGIAGASSARASVAWFGPGGATPANFTAVARWELFNPWAKIAEIVSTHPLTAYRIKALQKLNRLWNKPVEFSKIQPVGTGGSSSTSRSSLRLCSDWRAELGAPFPSGPGSPSSSRSLLARSASSSAA
jgi:hypothetical protein